LRNAEPKERNERTEERPFRFFESFPPTAAALAETTGKQKQTWQIDIEEWYGILSFF
jgi:hypothetical protein